jgi:hypothetical protein
VFCSAVLFPSLPFTSFYYIKTDDSFAYMKTAFEIEKSFENSHADSSLKDQSSKLVVETLEGQVPQMKRPTARQTNTTKTINAKTQDQPQLIEKLAGQVQQLQGENEKIQAETHDEKELLKNLVERHTETIQTLNATTLDQTQLIENMKGQVQQLQSENEKNQTETPGEKELLKNLHEQVQSLLEENVMIKKELDARNTEAMDGHTENTTTTDDSNDEIEHGNSDSSAGTDNSETISGETNVTIASTPADSENSTDSKETATTDDSEKIVVKDNKKEITISSKTNVTIAPTPADSKNSTDSKETATTDDSEKMAVTNNKTEITISGETNVTIAPTPSDSKNGTDSKETTTTDDSEKIVVTDNKTEITTNKQATPNGKVFSHFLSHIPKSGSSYAFNAINKLLWPSAEWNALPEGKRFQACNEATKATTKFDEYDSEYKGNYMYHVDVGARLHIRTRTHLLDCPRAQGTCFVHVLPLQRVPRSQKTEIDVILGCLVGRMGRCHR